MLNIEKARKLRDSMNKRRTQVKATLKELQILLSCWESGNYTAMFSTKLYIKYGGEYCEYFILLNELE